MRSQTGADLPGLELGRLAPWISEHVPGAAAELNGTVVQARQIAGGRSNLTYEISDGTSTWILRRPPLGQRLATAHDMAREFTVMSALEDTAVPVPQVLALCKDDAVLNAPFYLMERVEGFPYRWENELTPLGSRRVRAISEQLVDALATLHAVHPDAVGLSSFGRAEGFLARQVRRWGKQLAACHSRDLRGADELHRQLTSRVEKVERAGTAPGIVHGDYRLDNVLLFSDRAAGEHTDTIRAIIDWEMATIGDPLTDLALMLVYGRCATQPAGHVITDAVLAPGFLSEDELIARYAEASHRDLSDFDIYIGLASYKLAAILEGIHHRHVNGQTVGDGFEGIGDCVAELIDSGLAALGNS